jgi:hypothetical protein
MSKNRQLNTINHINAAYYLHFIKPLILFSQKEKIRTTGLSNSAPLSSEIMIEQVFFCAGTNETLKKNAKRQFFSFHS